MFFLLLLPQVLKNGVVLCQLMNKISPGSVPKFKTSGPAFLLMENIGAFQVGRREKHSNQRTNSGAKASQQTPVSWETP